MFVKLNSPEEAAFLFDKIMNEYIGYCGDLAYTCVSTENYDQATQKFPVVVFVQEDYENPHTFIHFPSKIYVLEEV